MKQEKPREVNIHAINRKDSGTHDPDYIVRVLQKLWATSGGWLGGSPTVFSFLYSVGRSIGFGW